MTSKKLVLIVLLIVSNIAVSQHCTYTFSGIVEDFHDKSALVGATIYIKNLNKYTTSDIDGKFEIKNICAGKITVEISHLACERITLEMEVSKDLYKVIDLEHHTEALDEVKLKVTHGKRSITAQETIVKTRTIEKYSDRTLGDALKNVAGVSSINTGNSIVKPIINGLHSSRILISLNGVRLQDQDWGIEHAPNVDINAFGSISVIKGANALEYGGDAIGGVIALNPTQIIKKDTLYGKTIISQQSNGVLASLSTSLYKSFEKGWFINGQGSYKSAGDFSAKDYDLTNTGIRSKGLSLHTGFKKFEKGFDASYSYLSNELGILASANIGNAADLVRAINSDTPITIRDFSFNINNPKQEVVHQIAKLSAYQRFKGLGKLSFQYDFQRNERLEFDIRRGDKNEIPAADLLLKTHALKADMKFDANAERTYKVGISGAYQNNFADPDTGVRRLIPDYDKYTAGVYAIADINLSDNLTLSTGVRYDFSHINAKKFYIKSRWEALNYNENFRDLIIEDAGTQYLTNPVFTYHNVSASAGLQYNFNENNTVLFNYGLANRAPNPSELFSDGLHQSASRIELGNLETQPETSHRFSSTYTYNTNTFTFSAEGFFNRINDFIYIEPSGSEISNRGAFIVWSYKQTNAHLFGIDTNINYQINKNIAINNKSSLIKGQDITLDRPLIDIPPFKTVSTVTFKKEKWRNFYTSLTSEFNASQNEYPNNNFTVFIATTGKEELVDISTPPDAYHLLNFSTGFDIQLSDTKINLNFSVDNLLNTSYRNYLNRQRNFADDLGRNFKIQLKINY